MCYFCEEDSAGHKRNCPLFDGANNNKDSTKYTLTGWICPNCGRSNSPYSTQCTCPPVIVSSTTIVSWDIKA